MKAVDIMTSLTAVKTRQTSRQLQQHSEISDNRSNTTQFPRAKTVYSVILDSRSNTAKFPTSVSTRPNSRRSYQHGQIPEDRINTVKKMQHDEIHDSHSSTAKFSSCSRVLTPSSLNFTLFFAIFCLPLCRCLKRI